MITIIQNDHVHCFFFLQKKKSLIDQLKLLLSVMKQYPLVTIECNDLQSYVQDQQPSSFF